MPWTLLGAAALWLIVATPASAQIAVDVDQPDAPAAHEWVATGFVGPTFGNSVDQTSTGFGGVVTYLYDRAIGAEVIANFTPDFGFASGPATDSAVNSYMANAIAAAPLGRDGRFQPFVSGGLGAMRLRADVQGTNGLVRVEDTQLGANVGVGMMMFNNQWGVRTDLRYFTGIGDENGSGQPDLVDPADILADTSYWRYDLGISYRW